MSDAPLPSGLATPKVSVAMITYNHERFIAQAIESVLMQQADFPIELVIGEDCSADGTRKIVEQYARLRPDVIRPLLHTKNLGMHGNGRAVLCACRGEFIACLEGDDFWTDPQKLAQQVASLESDPRIALTWHSLQLVDGEGRHLNRLPDAREHEAVQTLEELVSSGMPGTPGVMLRRELLNLDELAEFACFPQGDYPMWVLACRGGRLAHYDPRCMAAYRRHAGGATNGFAKPEMLISLAEMWELLAVKAGMCGHPAFNRHVWENYFYASRAFADQGQVTAAFRALIRSPRFASMPLGRLVREYGKSLARIGWCALGACPSAKPESA